MRVMNKVRFTMMMRVVRYPEDNLQTVTQKHKMVTTRLSNELRSTPRTPVAVDTTANPSRTFTRHCFNMHLPDGC